MVSVDPTSGRSMDGMSSNVPFSSSSSSDRSAVTLMVRTKTLVWIKIILYPRED